MPPSHNVGAAQIDQCWNAAGVELICLLQRNEGLAGHALLMDCRSLETTPLPMPEELCVVVLDSAAPRELAGSAYNQRRAECEAAVAKLQVAYPEIRALRDVSPAMLAAEEHRLDQIERQRARHVVSENRRSVVK